MISVRDRKCREKPATRMRGSCGLGGQHRDASELTAVREQATADPEGDGGEGRQGGEHEAASGGNGDRLLERAGGRQDVAAAQRGDRELPRAEQHRR